MNRRDEVVEVLHPAGARAQAMPGAAAGASAPDDAQTCRDGAGRLMLQAMAEPDDRDLMMRYGKGDATAFERLYGRHKGPLFRYFVRRCGQRELAEELFQEVWTRVINTRATYRPTAKFTTWLYTLAQRCLIDHARHTARRIRLVGDERIDEQATSAAPDAARAVDADYVGTRFANALAALPAEQRDAFLLHQESGLTLVQIAQVTGAERETVKSRLRYALGKLRAALADVHEDLTGTP